MCISSFSATFVRNIFHSKKNLARYDQKCKAPIIPVRFLINLAHSRQIFEKYSNIKFHENPSSGSRVVPCGQKDGQTDGHEEANSRFSQFCERA